MYDYNFFENYKIKKKKTQPGTGILLVVFLLVVAILGGVSAYTYDVNNGIKDEIQSLEDELNNPNNVELIKRISVKEELLTNITGMVTGLKASNAALMVEEPINAALFETIVLALPADAQINHMTVNQELVTMMGMAAQQSAIAEFEKTLREAELVQDVHVLDISSITVDETDAVEYTFSIIIEIGGVTNENIN